MLRRGSAYLAFTAVQAIVVISALPVLANLMSPAPFGRTAIALVHVQFTSILFGVGLAAAISRAVFDRDRPLLQARSIIGLAIVVSVLLTSVALASGPIWAELIYARSFDLSLFLATAAGGVMSISVASQSLFQATEQITKHLALAFLAGPGAFLAGLVFALFGPSPEHAFVVGFFVALAASAAIALWLSRPILAPKVVQEFARSAFKLALPTVPHLVSLVILISSDRIIVSRITGAESAGRYHVAYLFGAAAVTAMAGANNAWMPVFLRSAKEGDWSVVVRTTRMFHRLALPVLTVVAAGSPVLLQLLLDDDGQATWQPEVIGLVAICLAPYVTYLAAGHILLHSRATGRLGLVSVSTAILVIPLSVVLVTNVGPVGAALATTVGYSYQAIAARLVADRRIRVGWRLIDDVRIWLVAYAVGAITMALPTRGLGLFSRLALVSIGIVWAGRLLLSEGILPVRRPCSSP